MNAVYRLYLFSKSLRHMVLFTLFGAVSACKHEQPCGEYFLQVLQKQGIIAAVTKGVPRIITCY